MENSLASVAGKISLTYRQVKRALEIADARMDLVRHSAEVGGSDVVGPLGFIVIFVRFVKDGVSIKAGAVFFCRDPGSPSENDNGTSFFWGWTNQTWYRFVAGDLLKGISNLYLMVHEVWFGVSVRPMEFHHVWYIYLHLVAFYGKLVGKYTSPMDPLG